MDPGVEASKHRRMRNYLLEPRFQLKFTAFTVGVTVVVAALLSGFIWSTTQALFAETANAVDARMASAEKSKELGHASLSNRLLEQYNDPELAKKLREESDRIDEAYEHERAQIVAARAALVKRQELTAIALGAGFLSFILFIAFSTIILTHRIVGPLYRIKRAAVDVAEGKLPVLPDTSRNRDEFKDVFESVSQMLAYLRGQRSAQLAVIRRARDAASANNSKDVLEALAELEQQVRKGLE